DTVIGPISFGPDGEWKQPRIICIQFKDVTGGDISQFTDWSRQVVVYPPEFKAGDLIFPCANANK
ncbi:MAG: branched-chain amino acid ABC transporter substrate-binding protein, partial [Pseudorhodoplanes sp.]